MFAKQTAMCSPIFELKYKCFFHDPVVLYLQGEIAHWNVYIMKEFWVDPSEKSMLYLFSAQKNKKLGQ